MALGVIFPKVILTNCRLIPVFNPSTEATVKAEGDDSKWLSN